MNAAVSIAAGLILAGMLALVWYMVLVRRLHAEVDRILSEGAKGK